MGAFITSNMAKALFTGDLSGPFHLGVDGAMSGGAESSLGFAGGLWIYCPLMTPHRESESDGETCHDPLVAFYEGRTIGPILLIGRGRPVDASQF